MSATQNTKIEPNSKVVEFLKLVFANKRDLVCAKIILTSLPFEIFSGGQKRVVAIAKEQDDPLVIGKKLKNPSRHYWETIRKLRQIGMVTIITDWNRSATKKIRWYDKDNDGFVKLLNSVSSSWLRFCRSEQ